MFFHAQFIPSAMGYISTIKDRPHGTSSPAHYPWIAVSRQGRIYAYGRNGWKECKQHESKTHHCHVSIRVPKPIMDAMIESGAKKEQLPKQRFQVHRLVAITYITNPSDAPQVRHLDGNPRNNDVSNLAWGTAKENSADRWDHGTMLHCCGENHANARKSGTKVEHVIEWRDRCLTNGESYASVGRDFGVSYQTVRMACLTSWQTVPYRNHEQESEARMRVGGCKTVFSAGKDNEINPCLPSGCVLARILAKGSSITKVADHFKVEIEDVQAVLSSAGYHHATIWYMENCHGKQEEEWPSMLLCDQKGRLKYTTFRRQRRHPKSSPQVGSV